MIRLFLFDKGAPDHVSEWDIFASYVQAVLNVGAKPMMTFAKFRPPFDDPSGVRRFADQSADVARRCIDHWGGETVRDWYWCVWNEPNMAGSATAASLSSNIGASMKKWRKAWSKWLDPYLGGRRPLIGGPAVEGFPNFWWIGRGAHQ